MPLPQHDEETILYPESDGQPMSDNTLQYEWIVTIKENLDERLPDFVAADLLWYPVQGQVKTRTAPDVMVAIGRPKGHRRSYLQWREDNIAPQVVFEILSPSNTLREMITKAVFYAHHGVEEFYAYDPKKKQLLGWLMHNQSTVPIANMNGHVSPRLGIRFDDSGDDLVIYDRDGVPFQTVSEIIAARDAAQQQFATAKAQRDAAQAERDAALAAQAAAQTERDAAQAARDAAQAARDAAQAERDAAQAERDALRAQLRALGIEL